MQDVEQKQLYEFLRQLEENKGNFAKPWRNPDNKPGTPEHKEEKKKKIEDAGVTDSEIETMILESDVPALRKQLNRELSSSTSAAKEGEQDDYPEQKGKKTKSFAMSKEEEDTHVYIYP